MAVILGINLTYVPPTKVGGHIVFGADPVGVRVASLRALSFEPMDGF